MTDDRSLPIWVLYDHPSDYPDRCIARRFVIRAGQQVSTGEVLQAATIAELRAKRPTGFVTIPRSPEDDPVIVESWL